MLYLTGNSLDIIISDEQIENLDYQKLLGLYVDNAYFQFPPPGENLHKTFSYFSYLMFVLIR